MARRPPEAVELLLAQIWLLIARGLGGDKAKHLEIYDIAPWLDTEHAQMERAKATEDSILATVASLVGSNDAK